LDLGIFRNKEMIDSTETFNKQDSEKTYLDKVSLSLLDGHCRHLPISHQINSFVTQSPLPACLQCQIRTHSTKVQYKNEY
jgi:hypothetical protein